MAEDVTKRRFWIWVALVAIAMAALPFVGG